MNRVTRWFLLPLTFVMIAAFAASLVAQEIPAAVAKAEQARIAAIAKATTSSVSVFANGGRGGGSGVVIWDSVSGEVLQTLTR